MMIAQRPSTTRIASVGSSPIKSLVWSVFTVEIPRE